MKTERRNTKMKTIAFVLAGLLVVSMLGLTAAAPQLIKVDRSDVSVQAQTSSPETASHSGGSRNRVATPKVEAVMLHHPADFNHDGVKDSRDFVAFLNAYASGNLSANMDGDSNVTENDFWIYSHLFQDGDLAADYNDDGVKNSQDFVAFLNDYVEGSNALPGESPADMNGDKVIDEKDFKIYLALFQRY